MLVIGKTLEEHNQNLAKFLERIRGADLQLKPKKCMLVQPRVRYLGHIVSEEGAQTDVEKLAAVGEFLLPFDVKTRFGVLLQVFRTKFCKGCMPITLTHQVGLSFQVDSRVSASVQDSYGIVLVSA